MASNGYLRTVRVGGFDKQDVLAYVDDLTSKIYTLEAQVNDQNETIERLEKQGGAQKQDFEGKKELDPTSSSENGLENGWGGSEVGSLIYGTEECGIFAAKTDITWTNYRLALKINGEETPFTSITYNVTVSGLELDS